MQALTLQYSGQYPQKELLSKAALKAKNQTSDIR